MPFSVLISPVAAYQLVLNHFFSIFCVLLLFNVSIFVFLLLQLIHCIVWAKELALAKLFGDKSQVSDLDVRPSTNEDNAVSNDPDEAQFFEIRSGESSKAYGERVFDRIFGQNIVTALQNEDTWKSRRRPEPLFLEKVLTEDVVATTNGTCSSERTVSATASLGLKNPQEVWSVKDNARVFLESVQLFLEKRSQVHSSVMVFHRRAIKCNFSTCYTAYDYSCILLLRVLFCVMSIMRVSG